MDINLLSDIGNGLSFFFFIGIVIWAWSGRNRERFEEAANLPFEQD